MKPALPFISIVAAVTVALTGCSASPGAAPSAPPVAAAIVVAASADAVVTATTAVASGAVAVRAEPAAAPAHAAPAVAPVAKPVRVASSASSAPNAPAASTNTAAAHTAYINAMYRAVVPARERAALAGRYVLGYNLPGLGCGTGCTGLFNGQARSSFNAAFIAQAVSRQRNTIAHEAAHAYGYLYIPNYTVPSWAGMAGWQSQFHAADRGFARIYDAEAWASCVAWQESGDNNRVDQITHVCTSSAATLAMAQIH